nr:GHKL domain-containing protein [uncultured Schaedlerella sp.]
MVKIILLTGIEALNLYLCIYLAYNLIAERADSRTVKQKVLLILICGIISFFNALNLQTLYYNNGVWITTDLFLMLLFKYRKERHNLMRGCIAILTKHLIIYIDYAMGFLLMNNDKVNYSMRTVLYSKNLKISGIFLAVRIILLIAVIILTSQIKRKFSDLHQTRRVLVIVDIISYLGVLLFQQLFLEEINQIYINSFYVTVALGVILCIVFYVYDSSASRRKREQLINTTNKLMEQNYQKLYNEQKKLEYVTHDFKNHINLLIKYLKEEKYDEAIEYGNKLSSPLEVISQRSWSGNKTVDTILNTKLLEAEQKSIEVHMEVDHMVNFPLADYDLCVVLSNLFDNAIEACEYTKKEKKEINITIKSTGALCIIKFVNSMERKPIKKKQKYQTIKKDKEVHGIGLESVKSSLEKYQGTLLLDDTENQFTAVASVIEQSSFKIQEKEASEEIEDKKMKWRKREKKHAENERIRWRFENRISGD